MAHYGVPATVRASFSIYNTVADADALCASLDRVRAVFQ
jgi:cysteine desulfurase/selenocysteine lyase